MKLPISDLLSVTSKGAVVWPKGENVVLLSETLYGHEKDDGWTRLSYVILGHANTSMSTKRRITFPFVCTSILSVHYV